MGKGGNGNLIPYNELTEEQQRDLTVAGGKASVEAKRKRKALKETLEILLSKPYKDGKIDDIEEIKSIADLKGTNITTDQIIMVSMVNKAMKGDQRAIEYITNVIGENPIQKLQIDAKLETKRIEIVWERPPNSESSNAGDPQ